ncbi:hypothetical protein HG535_0D04190 [Zygotorulaspora mrakii]|uniref:Crossover junction endonuclease MUS81 n=1 Tax=Zygotorulaspora mrakii TaxID=42260 RepID=A0A7H9B239_ZYGMR|nr:uncharacterized protein HG535_0D04190 [Zygotorulaspora mrakii]QLG72711.1 hypothetical protein HG535_0D04190 [Zygotorulaspora mrakii]
MSLPSNLKNLYAEWLQELIVELNPRQEQLNLTYEKARRHLLETEGIIFYPKDLKKIKGIGETIMKRLEKKLMQHCQEIGAEFPQPRPAVESSSLGKRTTTILRSKSFNGGFDEPEEQQLPKKKKVSYIPRKRSGGYGILLALLEHRAILKGISRDDVIKTAQKYCDSSMDPNFMTKELRGAWSAIHSLKKHDLVLEGGRPRKYSLTEAGVTMATTLKSAADITFPFENQTSAGHQCESETSCADITADFCALFESDSNKRREALLDNESTSLMDMTFHNSIVAESKEEDIPRNDDTMTTSSPKLTSNRHKTVNRDHILKRKFNGVSYELWLQGSYEVYPIIDHREIKSHGNRDFFSIALETKGIKCGMRQLALGDILWVAKHKKSGSECIINTIIERKRLDDLAFSIRDNRFMEQKSRLDKSGCRNKYYLIEETMSKALEGMNEALKTALWLILVYYRFSMIRTSNSDETVDRLHALHTVIVKEYSKKKLIVIYPTSLRNQDDYLKVLEQFRDEFEKFPDIECCHSFQCFQEILGKGELSTIRELTIQILMYVKGVSIEKAVAIQTLFPTLNHLLVAYRNCRTDEEAKLLMFHKLGEAPGAKKITKSLSEKLAGVFGSFTS